MAYSFLLWPETLPGFAQVSGFSPEIPSTINRQDMDEGSRQKTRGTPVQYPVNAKYVMKRAQMEALRDFSLAAGARSFWMPYPDPKSDMAAAGLFRYAQFSPSGNALSSPTTLSRTIYSVPLVLNVWAMVPGQSADGLKALVEEHGGTVTDAWHAWAEGLEARAAALEE